ALPWRARGAARGSADRSAIAGEDAHPLGAGFGARRQDPCGATARRVAPHTGAPRGRMGPGLSGWRTPHWLASSVRNKLLAMALLPLLVAFPLLVLALAVWSNQAYDRLLITKVRSDLAVAQGYFDQVLIEVGSGTLGVADSRALADALRPGTPEARAQLSAHLAA